MEISFADAGLKALCEKPAVARKRLGDACSRKLRARLADLSAAASVRELVAGRPHPLRGERLGQLALDLAGGTRLVFEPADDPVPRDKDGSIDWSHVTSVRIIHVGDYHD